MAGRVTALAAFGDFCARVSAGESGAFFSERLPNGTERWVSGWGEMSPADFEKGPFPVFSIADFSGQDFRCVRFAHMRSFKDEWDPSSSPALSAEITAPSDWERSTADSRADFVEKIKQAQRAARDGELWVINLATEFFGEGVPEGGLKMFQKMLAAGVDHCGGIFWTEIEKMCSFSPEVFVRQEGATLRAEPIKGTGSREYLNTSEKEISELRMVTDLLRNDLGQIADQVRVPELRTLRDRGQFWHAHAEISATLPESIFCVEDFKKLLPAGSISGAPKKRVCEYIKKLESFNRGDFTGTFGVKFSPEQGSWNVLIRTLFFYPDGTWRLPVGVGITHQSDPEAEWEELIKKAKNVFRWS